MKRINNIENNTAFGLCNGEIKHISEVKSGLECSCVCLACGGELVAKKGEKNEHHFAHHIHPEQPCNESIVHQLSKRIIQQYKKVQLPEIQLSYQESDILGEAHDEFFNVKPYTLQFDDVTVEQPNCDYIPDVTGFTIDGDTMDIEIVVTNDVSEEKLEKIKTGQHCVLRIYMKDYNAMQSFETLKKAVIYDAPRDWVNNSEIDMKRKQLKESVMKCVETRNAFIIEKVKAQVFSVEPTTKAVRAPKEDEVVLLGFKSAFGYSPKTKKDYDFSVLHVGDIQKHVESMNYTTKGIGGFDINKEFYFDPSLIPKLESFTFPCVVALSIGNKLKNGRLLPLVVEIDLRE